MSKMLKDAKLRTLKLQPPEDLDLLEPKKQPLGAQEQRSALGSGNAPESVKSFIESRRHSIDEGTWFALAAAFNSCRLNTRRGKAILGR